MFSSSHFHPMIVHFPIAIIMIGFIADVLSLFFKKQSCLSFAAFWLVIIGALGAVAAYLTGEFFTNEMTGAAGDLKETHEVFAKITMWIMIANAALRVYLKYTGKENTSFKWLAFALFAVAAVTVGFTGLYGGSLVYNYMIH